ncbi:ABC transporter ATP-binding protein [Bacteriovorax sp. PP10]|uniref:ABC transporter ATP-binding protein n=1 Tax=Bacteriovorax antarcticus TaxID=3088717 RepID=A0ABU5VRB5_9BACT|nr:ABC transporter ATP-binding protein [Bacteriovorax sp. PP10]MEA9355452.1 ABC transporter ATP-binding protein [Bacteriovorax sp. PP10]
MSSNVIIKIENVKKTYTKSQALRGVSFVMNEGEEYLIRGASGSGKSTLLYLLGGLDRPTEGRVIVNQNNLVDLSDEDLALYRNRYVGFVFQFHFLLSSMNCMDNILLPARLGGVESDEVVVRAKNLAKLLNVEHCLEKYPYELSGGEQQRINIIRALSLKPKLLLCDEPTGNLDSENSHKVIQLLRTLAKEFGATLVVVTHDPQIAQSFSNQLVMKDGLLITQ